MHIYVHTHQHMHTCTLKKNVAMASVGLNQSPKVHVAVFLTEMNYYLDKKHRKLKFIHSVNSRSTT